ncbi:MAG TPA: hypothetical protein VNQ90_19935 [Chthoniobacteraceae bacterium]|nr:hypothetical protein [Chthoniobacteraceae bacterium]
MKSRLLSAIALLSLSVCVQAHYLWIESDHEGEARIYFGEYNEGVKEKAGGRLDERDRMEGQLVAPDQAASPLRLVKKADHFVARTGKSGWLLVSDVTNEVKDWRKSDIGIVKPMFYARAAVGNQPLPDARPTLALDLIPDAAHPQNLRVYFNKKPLPKAKVIVTAPNLWMQELQCDQEGRVSISTPWPGRYVIEVIYKERKPGQFNGVAYEAIRHRVTYSQNY